MTCQCGKHSLAEPFTSAVHPGLVFEPMHEANGVDAEGRKTIEHHTPNRCRVEWAEGIGWRSGRSDDEWQRPWMGNCPRCESMSAAELTQWFLSTEF